MKLRFQDHNEKTKALNVSKIGKGAFTTAYKTETGEVILVTCDPMKEIPTIVRGLHIPELQKLGYKQESEVYSSPFYAKIEPRTPAWKHMQELKKLLKFQSRLVREITDEEVEALDIPDTLRHDLLNILNWASSYDYDAYFEISPRNVKVDSQGNLILLDVVLSGSLIMKSRKPTW